MFSFQAHLRPGEREEREQPSPEDPVPVRLHELEHEPDRVRNLQHEPEEEARTHHRHTNQFLVQTVRAQHLPKYLATKQAVRRPLPVEDGGEEEEDSFIQCFSCLFQN